MSSIRVEYVYDERKPVIVGVAIFDGNGILEQSLESPGTKTALIAKGGRTYASTIDGLGGDFATLLFSKLTGQEMSWRDPYTD